MIEELGCGSLYSKIRKKLTEDMLIQYHRWIYEEQQVESVMTMLEWLNREAEYQTIAVDMVHGVTSSRD